MKYKKTSPYKKQVGRTLSMSKGFTLIELMVALTLFVMVVLAAVSALYSVNSASRRVQAMRNVLDNLNFAMESMSRTIRTGSDIVCSDPYPTSGNNCPYGSSSGTDSISVHSTLGIDSDVEYQYVSNGSHGEVQKRIKDMQTSNWSRWVSITAPEINVQTFTFYVDGANKIPIDTKQPSVILFMSGVASAGADNIQPFSLQTYISQRNVE